MNKPTLPKMPSASSGDNQGFAFKSLLAAFLICAAEMLLFLPLALIILMPLEKFLPSLNDDWMGYLLFETTYFIALGYVNPTKFSAFTKGFQFAGVAWLFYAFMQLLTAASIDFGHSTDTFNWRYISAVIPVVAAIAQAVFAWKLSSRRPQSPGS